MLAALPASTVRIEVERAELLDRIRSAVARPALEVVHRPTPRSAAVYVRPPD